MVTVPANAGMDVDIDSGVTGQGKQQILHIDVLHHHAVHLLLGSHTGGGGNGGVANSGALPATTGPASKWVLEMGGAGGSAGCTKTVTKNILHGAGRLDRPESDQW
jgi:hypothetical protein